jgi:hypothetical protein
VGYAPAASALGPSIYTITDQPAYTLAKLVTLFWFITTYTLLAKSVTVLTPPGEERRVIRHVLLPLLAVLGIMHLVGLLRKGKADPPPSGTKGGVVKPGV